MQFKNLHIVFAFISFALTVLSAPMGRNGIEASNVPGTRHPDNKKIERILNGGAEYNINKINIRKNPLIEPSYVPVPNRPDNKQIEKILNDAEFNGKNPYIEASPIPVKGDNKLIDDFLKEANANQKRSNEKNPLIEASYVPVTRHPDNKQIQKMLDEEKNHKGKKHPIKDSPIPIRGDKKIAAILNDANANEKKIKTLHMIEPSYVPVPNRPDNKKIEKILNDAEFNGKNPYIEASPIPVKGDNKLIDDFLKEANANQEKSNEKNPLIEASYVPVTRHPDNKQIQKMLDEEKNHKSKKQQQHIKDQIPIKGDKKIAAILKENNANKNNIRKNPLIEPSYVPVPNRPDNKKIEKILNDAEFNGKNPNLEASPIPVKSHKKINDDILNN